MVNFLARLGSSRGPARKFRVQSASFRSYINCRKKKHKTMRENTQQTRQKKSAKNHPRIKFSNIFNFIILWFYFYFLLNKLNQSINQSIIQINQINHSDQSFKSINQSISQSNQSIEKGWINESNQFNKWFLWIIFRKNKKKIRIK